MIRVRRSDPPAITPQTIAKVSNGLLPVLGWRDVPVLHEIRQELTVLERFVLEMALALGRVTAEDFAEVVSLPRQVLAAAASRLIAGRALMLVDDGYEVEPTIATRALRERGIRRQLPATADFVLLPRTGDLLALPPGKNSWLRQLEMARITPAGNAPVPGALWDQRRCGYLAARVRAGQVTLVDTDVVDVSVPADDPLLASANGTAPLCPAYNCRAELIRDERGQTMVRAVLHGLPRRRKKDSSNASKEVPIQLTGADNVVSEWLGLTAAMQEQTIQRDAWQEMCSGQPFSGARQRGPVQWEFRLDEQAALAIATEQRPLDQPFGLELQNDEATVELVGWFVPDDDAAREMFARDRTVGRLLTAASPATDLADVCRSVAAALEVPLECLTLRDIRDRAWDLGYYRLAYALRESEDFAYD